MSVRTDTPRLRLDMPLTGSGRGVLRHLADLAALLRQRRALADLDERTLQDIGVSRADALREASRAPWDMPSGWRR